MTIPIAALNELRSAAVALIHDLKDGGYIAGSWRAAPHPLSDLDPPLTAQRVHSPATQRLTWARPLRQRQMPGQNGRRSRGGGAR